jgi:hypothetical protein
MITPQEFVDKWWRSKLGERPAAQSHFNDLCRMRGHHRLGAHGSLQRSTDEVIPERLLALNLERANPSEGKDTK